MNCDSINQLLTLITNAGIIITYNKLGFIYIIHIHINLFNSLHIRIILYWLFNVSNSLTKS